MPKSRQAQLSAIQERVLIQQDSIVWFAIRARTSVHAFHRGSPPISVHKTYLLRRINATGHILLYDTRGRLTRYNFGRQVEVREGSK